MLDLINIFNIIEALIVALVLFCSNFILKILRKVLKKYLFKKMAFLLIERYNFLNMIFKASRLSNDMPD